MASDILLILIRMNLAIGLVVAGLLATRTLIRRACGADVAYTLWVLVPVTGVAMLIDGPRTGDLLSAPFDMIADSAPWLLTLWASGVAIALVVVAHGHRRTLALARRGELGPAVTGLFRPRLYLPSDFAIHFDVSERSVIRSHERAHLLRQDALANHGLVLGQCLFWFNPFIHIAGVYLRRDQEMACDLMVMDERPEQRGLYAKTMLKTQLLRPVPRLGCGWARHPLEERVRALRQAPPTYLRVLGIMALCVGAFQLLVTFAVVTTP